MTENTRSARLPIMNWTQQTVRDKDYQAIWIPDPSGSKLPSKPTPQSPLEVFYYSDAHGAFFSGNSVSFPERLAAKRDQVPSDTLLLTGGDEHGGGSIWDAFIAESLPSSVGFDLMHRSGVDAFVIGNHDLDWGQQPTIDSLQRLNINLVISSLQPNCPLAAVSQPAFVFQFKDKLIGLLGVPNTKYVMGGNELFVDPMTALTPLIEAMNPHVNAFIVISHLGTADDELLQTRLPPNTLLCGSHTHQLIPSYGEEPVPRQYLQSGSKCEAYGHAKWDEAANWQTSNHPAESLPQSNTRSSLDYWNAAKESLLKAKGLVSFHHPSFTKETYPTDSYRSENPRMNWACDQLATLAKKDSQRTTIVMLCARSLGKVCFKPNMDFENWYQSLPYGDRIVRLRLKVDELDALIRLNAERVCLTPSYLEEEGFLHFDSTVRQTIESNALSSKTTQLDFPRNGSEIEILTQTYVASGAGGYKAKFDSLGIKATEIEVLDLSLREFLWERAKSLSPIEINPLDGRLKFAYTADKGPSLE